MWLFLEIHTNGRSVKGSKFSFIVLISKMENSQNLYDFIPMSLVGRTYKVLSKILVNKLKQVISKVISEIPFVFVKERQIQNGILIANEIVGEAKRKKKN